MAHSVKIRTAIPTLEEYGNRLGISKKRQKALIALVERDFVSRGVKFEPMAERVRMAKSGSKKA